MSEPHGHGHDHGHGHSHGAHAHGHGLPPVDPGPALAAGIAINLAFVAIEGGLGIHANSLALLADATHNLGDVLGLVMAWVAVRLSRKPPSTRFTYGLGASSILAALANALLLVGVTGGLAWEALQRLRDPEPLQGGIVIAVALVGVVVNGATALLLYKGHNHNLNVKGAYLHMLADAAVSVGVAIAGALVLVTGWVWLDPAVTLVVGAVIVAGTWGLLRDSTRLAMQGVPPAVDCEGLRGYLGQLPGVSQVHDFHVWAMSTTENAMTAHLVCPGGHPGDAFLADATHAIAHRYGVRHVTLQVERGDCGKGCD